MSDTPRTDDWAWKGQFPNEGEFCEASFARVLERENNQLRKELEEARRALFEMSLGDEL